MTETMVEALPVRLTPTAVRHAKALIARKGEPERSFLRLGVRGGGCSGYSYVVDLDDEVGPRDQLFDVEGLRVVIDRKSLALLNGSVLDYDTTNLLEGGFKFDNPNAARSCGCGISFQL